MFDGIYTFGGEAYGMPPNNKKEPGKVYFQRHPGDDWNLKFNPHLANKLTAASFLCPCGGGHSADLTLWGNDSRDEHPSGPAWEFEIHEDQTVTFKPSIHRIVDPGCHYFIERGKVRWA